MDKCNLVGKLSELGRFWRVEFEELTWPEQVFCSVWELECQVCNGGFHQYFFNSTGDIAFCAVTALNAIGATKCAEFVRQAMTVFEDGDPPRDRAARIALIDALSDEERERLNSLDEQFYTYPDNLTELLFDFVVRNKTDIQGAARLKFEVQ